MTIATFYPNAHVESTSVDGYARHYVEAGTSWAALVGGAGTEAWDDIDTIRLTQIGSNAVANKWEQINRAIILFDTSVIPLGATIIAATLSLYGSSKTDIAGWKPNINIYASAPASNVAVVAGDFDSLGSTPLSTAIAYDDFSDVAYNDFVLNAAGLAAITKGGITKLGTRNANYDVANTAPSWVANANTIVAAWSAERVNGDTYKPKLVVTYPTLLTHTQAHIIG